jgi:sugar transport protein
MNPGPAANAAITFSFLLIVVYALTLAPVAWVYASEVWSLGTRAHGMAIASLANWLFNFALGLFVPPAFRNITWKTFIIFGVLCLGAAVQAYVAYPETARKSLEEIEEMFRPGGPHPWNTHVGNSHLEGHIAAVKANLDKAKDLVHHDKSPETKEVVETEISSNAQDNYGKEKV